MSGRPAVNIAIVGTGFIAETRARAYAGVAGYAARLVAAVSRTRERGEAYAQRHGIPDAYTDLERALERPDVDVVDLCVPNYLHRPMTEAAAAAGKHVICSKPLTAFDGTSLPQEVEPSSVARTQMLQVATDNATAMVEATHRAGVQLMYAENWVYAPSIAKADRLATAAGGAILEMRGGECHSGSHSPYSKQWRTAGGGALLRLGVHPIGAMLHLKRQEGLRRWGRPIRPRAVVAEVGDLTRTPGFEAEERHWVGTGWIDVENWASAVLTFDDGTRGIIWASDAVLGGMESSLQVLMSNAHIKCNLSHTRLVEAYAPDASVFGSEYLTEKLETSAGWSPPQPDEDWAQGHRQMMQDFVECVAEGRRPLSDGPLGLDAIRTVYAAYVAAEEGRRVDVWSDHQDRQPGSHDG
ncbi:MAG TPA: Gfo/Idh/MocA family oxidoreductase [Chloroflexota bacterium]|nr:Gfo/Idh/MocA family oxidoreductase [Chloroflexota bacterium]